MKKEEEALEWNRKRIDEAKAFIKKYGKDAALVYMLSLLGDSEERNIWILAMSDL
jgi:hypothetical protein